jgi:uncharacterized membrane protein
MSTVQILPIVAAVGTVLTTFVIGMRPVDSRFRSAWIFPAGLSLLFIAWSLFAMSTEGSLGFWTEHTRNRWGNQIWFDLLLAVSVSWSLFVPRAKARQMNIYPWLIFIICTGSIGLLTAISRLLFLEERASTKA